MKPTIICIPRAILAYGINHLLTLVVFLLLLSSCSKDDFNADLDKSTWAPSIAFPLAYAEIGMSDMAHTNDSSTTLIIDNNQFCTLIYHDKIFDLNATQLVQIPDQSNQTQFSLNNSEILTLNNTGQVQVAQSQDISFAVSQGVEIDSMILKNCNLVLDCSSGFPANSIVRLTIPGMKKNGVVFSEILSLNYSGTNPFTNLISIPLHNYHIDLTKNGTTNNTLTLNYVVTLNGNGAGVTTSNSIQCNTTFQSVKFQIMYGYVGQQSLANLPDSVQLSIFNNATGLGTFTIAEPKINFEISNSIGIPFHASISQLTAMNSNMTNFIAATGIPDPLPVFSPVISQTAQSLQSSFILDNNNSNITDLINAKPKYLIAQAQVTTNPSGYGSNFITDTSRLFMDVRVELPLYGTANDFKIMDTVPFNYSDLEKVENLTLRMNVENWFPIESSLQLVFTDANFVPLDTLFLPGEVVIPSGIINGSNDRVTVAGKKIHDHIFDKTRISRILNAENILIMATATTMQQGNTNVKIFNDYKLKLTIGAIAKMKIL